MARSPAKSVQQLIKEQKLRIAELEAELNTQLYFDTMPEYGPMYTYCYSNSSDRIPYDNYSVDAWIKATIRHMATRSRGHGGAKTKAVVISIPDSLPKENFDEWLGLQTDKIRKAAARSTRTKKA